MNTTVSTMARMFTPKGLRTGKKRTNRVPKRAKGTTFDEQEGLTSMSFDDAHGQVLDVEAPGPVQRTRHTVGVHRMDNGDEDDGYGDDDSADGDAQNDQELERLRSYLDESQQAEWEAQQGEMYNAKEQLRTYTSSGRKTGRMVMNFIDFIIKEDWLGGDALSGNLYRVWAFNGFKKPSLNILKGREVFDRNAQFVGTLFILLIQVMGPPMIIMGILYGWGSDDNYDFWKWNQFSTNKEWVGDENKRSTRILGLMFLFCFIANCMKVVLSEAVSFEKVWSVFNVLQCEKAKGMCSLPLMLGPIVNCTITITCSFAVFLIMGTAENPKDIVFDALGITFLFNLDDIGGDMAFISEEDWPGDRLNWIYDNMCHGEDPEDSDDPPPMWVKCIYYGTYCVLVLMSIVLTIGYIIIPWSNLKVEE